MILNYVGNADGIARAMGDSYVRAVTQHADYRRDVILRSLKGEDAAKDVEIALAAEKEHQRFVSEAAMYRAKMESDLAKAKLELLDALRIQDELTKYLSTSGFSPESALNAASMVADELARRAKK
jgi:hypothetical protein